jgi:hypothetical protein
VRALEKADDLAVLVGIRRHPVQVFGQRSGALVLLSAWVRSAIVKDGFSTRCQRTVPLLPLRTVSYRADLCVP